MDILATLTVNLLLQIALSAAASADSGDTQPATTLNAKSEKSVGISDQTTPANRDPEPDPKLFSSSTQDQTDVNSTRDDHDQGRPQKYVGNSFSLKFHKPSCPFAKVMRKSRRVAFLYRKAAVDAGQRPCKYCLPPWWLRVEAKLLNYDLKAEPQDKTPKQP